MSTLTTTLQCSPARYAAEILQAWRGKDLERLSTSLATAAAPELYGDALEGERAQLLSGIAAEMRDMLASGRTEGSAVCLNLLRHLACPRPVTFYTH
jgi:hypothetical protein